MVKNIVLAVAMLLITTNLMAAPTMDVSSTRHNLSKDSVVPGGNYYISGNEDEVCIFCHTPHGGTLDGPLWNRTIAANAGVGFTHYTSATLSGYFSESGMATRNVNAESLLCMSCHDGTVAVSNIINISNRTGAAPSSLAKVAPMFMFGVGADIGDIADEFGIATGASKNLSDDHPVSFSYYSAVAHADNNGKLRAADGLPAGSDPRLKGIRLFGADALGGQRVECPSCHDPHVNYEATNGGDAAYAPFLVMSNNGSALCLACHVK